MKINIKSFKESEGTEKDLEYYNKKYGTEFGARTKELVDQGMEELEAAKQAVREYTGLVTEDTVKTKSGKWVNKGKEGTHGEFDTKKQADAQRKAMFANGYNG